VTCLSDRKPKNAGWYCEPTDRETLTDTATEAKKTVLFRSSAHNHANSLSQITKNLDEFMNAMTSQQQDEACKPQPHTADEPLLDGAFRSLLEREDLSDVTLRGSDGILVCANRCILANRSSVFFGMLYGPFKEATNTVVDVGYHGKIIKAIVNYIYTDEVPSSPTNNDVARSVDFVRFAVTLLDAAEYFALSALRQKIETSIKQKMREYSKYAVFFMAACFPDCADTKVLQDTAVEEVKRNPQLIIHGTKSVVARIHPWYLKEILSQEKIPVDAHDCFKILQAWAAAEVASPDEHNDDSTAAAVQSNNEKKSRTCIASEMTSHIQLADISPTELSTMVTTSGLVTTEQLFEAYKSQALRSQTQIWTRNQQGAHVWRTSRTHIVGSGNERIMIERLDCPVLKSGVHTWSIKVLKGNRHFLGVTWIAGLWGPRGGRYVPNERSSFHGVPNVDVGSIVSFTLDLDNGDGILTASMNGSLPIEVASSMRRSHLHEDYGYVPAVTLQPNGSVEFLGFTNQT
jgi:BTB/POZ domain